MKKCPICHKTFTDFRFHGVLLTGSGSGVVDNKGQVSGIGPVTVQNSIAINEFITSDQLFIECPHCENVAVVTDYQTVLTCIFTGNETKNTIRIANSVDKFVDYPIAEEYIAEVKSIVHNSALMRYKLFKKVS